MQTLIRRLGWAVVACLGALGSAGAASLPAGVSAVRELEGVQEYRLDNGLQVLLIPDPSRPKVTVNVTYHVGSRMEGPGETGMAHLLEHLMFKSTQLYPNFGAELSKRGMEFNGTTWVDRTNYFETFAADQDLLHWALVGEADRMTGAKVLRSDLDTEMTVVRNEMESGENDPVRILMQRTQAAAYQWHSYGRSTIGARSDVENVAIPNLQAFYRKYYQPDNATLIVAGAFDAAATLQDIAQQFGKLAKPQRKIAPTYTLEPVQEGEREVTLRRRGGQQALMLSYHIPPGGPESAALAVLASVLSDSPTGRLHKRLVEGAKATQVFGWSERRAEPGLFNVAAVLKKEDSLDEAQRMMLATVEGLAAEPITAEELKRVQLQWQRQFDQIMADPQALCIDLSEAIANGDWRLLFYFRNQIQDVTLDQVNQSARRWLISSNRNLGRFVATDAPLTTGLIERVDVAETLKDFKPRAALASGEVFDVSPQNIDRRTERYTLPSGLRVALLPKKSRGETVQLALRMHYGNLQSLTGQRAEAALVGSLVSTGTAQKTRAQIADALDALQSELHIHSNVLDGAQATLTTKRAQLPGALSLLTEVLRQPSFAQSEIDQAVRAGISSLERQAQDPNGLAQLALERTLHAAYPEGDPRYAPTLEQRSASLRRVTRQSLLDFYQKHWGADHAELVLVGDFDPAQIKPLIAQALGDWRSATPYVRVPQPMPQVAGQRLQAVVKDKPNAIILGALSMPLLDDDPDYAALRLAVHVLGEGGFETRLMTRLRQKDGLSYGTGAYLSASSFEPAGQLYCYAIYAAPVRDKVEKAFAEELQSLVQNGITPAELDNAKKAMRVASDTWRADDAAVASAWQGHLERGRSFQWNADLDARGQALSVEQVNAAIRKWLQPQNMVWSLAGDFAP